MIVIPGDVIFLPAAASRKRPVTSRNAMSPPGNPNTLSREKLALSISSWFFFDGTEWFRREEIESQGCRRARLVMARVQVRVQVRCSDKFGNSIRKHISFSALLFLSLDHSDKASTFQCFNVQRVSKLDINRLLRALVLLHK